MSLTHYFLSIIGKKPRRTAFEQAEPAIDKTASAEALYNIQSWMQFANVPPLNPPINENDHSQNFIYSLSPSLFLRLSSVLEERQGENIVKDLLKARVLQERPILVKPNAKKISEPKPPLGSMESTPQYYILDLNILRLLAETEHDAQVPDSLHLHRPVPQRLPLRLVK